MEKTESQQLKLVFIGDSSVGKTAIIGRYITGWFEQLTAPTIGSMFFTKNITVNNKEFEIANLGHCRLGAILVDRATVLQRRSWRSDSIRCDKQGELLAPEQLDSEARGDRAR